MTARPEGKIHDKLVKIENPTRVGVRRILTRPSTTTSSPRW
jgi:hypothetical protein